MVAKTFDARRKFDLADEYDNLVERLQDVGYDTIPAATVLQTVSAILVKECSKKDILKRPKPKFINIWPQATEAIYAAVDYFRSYSRIPVSKLMPYGALLVPFGYFFFHHPDKPTGDQQKYLQDFFWRTSLGGRYSFALESRLAQDIRKIDRILKGKLPSYEYSIDIAPDFIKENGWFASGRSFIKAILCLFAHEQPKSFMDNSLVIISNDWLKRANSKNYHHFFPKASLKKHGFEDTQINQIANITIVDDFLNKRAIRAKAPSRYMAEFKRQNPDIDRTMKSHLIKLDSSGIWEDDYERVIQYRCKAISRKLSKRIIPQTIDNQGQEVYTDDYEEAEFEETSG